MDVKLRIKAWADRFNRSVSLAPEKQFSVEDVKKVCDDEFNVHCVAVKVRLTTLYANTLKSMCEDTATTLYGITPSDGGLILLLVDNETYQLLMK